MLRPILLAPLLLALQSSPSGRPPVGPLQRVEPRVYEAAFSVTISTLQQQNAFERRRYRLENAPIVLPMVFQGTYHRIDSSSLSARLWLEGREVDPRATLKGGYPFGTQLSVLTVEHFEGFSLRWQVASRVQVWSSKIDDAAAAKLAWPREWPAEVRDGLQPQMYIESDDPVFARAVQQVSGGKVRMVPPYLAAKDLVRYCINSIQVHGDGLNRGAFGTLLGLELQGAAHTAARGVGSPNDLVCVCVATLRAAEIPARAVVGLQEDENGAPEFVTWAEFYLHEAGWVPFDPAVMRGKGIRTLDVRKPWPEFGTLSDLNRRIPVAYHFIPPATVESPLNPAVWAWDPRPGGDPGSEQHINISITSRGRGVDDPQ